MLAPWATVLGQRLGLAARGAHVTQGAARGHPAEAVGAVVGSAATALGPWAQGLPEGVPEAGGHEAVEHRVGGRAEVEEDSRDDVHVLEGQEQALVAFPRGSSAEMHEMGQASPSLNPPAQLA